MCGDSSHRLADGKSQPSPMSYTPTQLWISSKIIQDGIYYTKKTLKKTRCMHFYGLSQRHRLASEITITDKRTIVKYLKAVVVLSK